MSDKYNLERRIALVRFLLQSRTDGEIERVIGYEKRSVIRVVNMLIRKGINIQSAPNEGSTGRHYWLAANLESSLSLVDPAKGAPVDRQKEAAGPTGPWFIIDTTRRQAYNRIEEHREGTNAKR